jgi:hypothetical protein
LEEQDFPMNSELGFDFFQKGWILRMEQGPSLAPQDPQAHACSGKPSQICQEAGDPT